MLLIAIEKTHKKLTGLNMLLNVSSVISSLSGTFTAYSFLLRPCPREIFPKLHVITLSVVQSSTPPIRVMTMYKTLGVSSKKFNDVTDVTETGSFAFFGAM